MAPRLRLPMTRLKIRRCSPSLTDFLCLFQLTECYDIIFRQIDLLTRLSVVDVGHFDLELATVPTVKYSSR